MGGHVNKDEVDEAIRTIRARVAEDDARKACEDIIKGAVMQKIGKEIEHLYVTPQPSRAQLPGNPKDRKRIPIATGVLFYFPDAIAEVARVSFEGNEQHNPGQPLHWAREKSTDHEDCIGRHLLQIGTRDTDNMRHAAKLAWRALALLQLEIEREREQREVQGHKEMAQGGSIIGYADPNTPGHLSKPAPGRFVDYLHEDTFKDPRPFVATDAHDAHILNTARAGMTL